jgi:glycolate oxidase FAD binding subunit
VSTTQLETALAQIVGRANVLSQRPRFDLDALPCAAPGSVDEVSALLKLATRDQLRVVPLGLGSKLGWCNAPERVDFLLTTRRLVGAVSHEPADGTIAVRAGESIAEVAARVERGGHRFTPDVPHPANSTIGGVVAAGQSGFDRLRFGPVQHHVLGVEAVLGDGTVTRSGGRLVKNVTGFDLHRLYAGSQGTLCVLTEVALRLFPAPEHEVLFMARGVDLARALERARAAFALPVRHVSVVLTSVDSPPAGESWIVLARLFGKRAAVAAEQEALAQCWKTPSFKEGREAAEFSAQFRDSTSFVGAQRASLSVTAEPSRAPALVVELVRALDDRSLERRLVFQPFEARLDIGLPSAMDPTQLAEFARLARNIATRHGGALHVRNAPLAALSGLDPFGDDVAGLELMRELRAKLDPGGVFARGRFVGGL